MSRVILPLKTHLMSTLSFKLRPTGTTSISTSRTEKNNGIVYKKKTGHHFFRVWNTQSQRTYYAFIERRLSSACSALCLLYYRDFRLVSVWAHKFIPRVSVSVKIVFYYWFCVSSLLWLTHKVGNTANRFYRDNTCFSAFICGVVMFIREPQKYSLFYTWVVNRYEYRWGYLWSPFICESSHKDFVRWWTR